MTGNYVGGIAGILNDTSEVENCAVGMADSEKDAMVFDGSI